MSNTTPITLHAPRRHHVRWVSLRKWCECRIWPDAPRREWGWWFTVPAVCNCRLTDAERSGSLMLDITPICTKDKGLCPRVNGYTEREWLGWDTMNFGPAYGHSWSDYMFPAFVVPKVIEDWDVNPQQPLVDETCRRLLRYIEGQVEGDKQ